MSRMHRYDFGVLPQTLQPLHLGIEGGGSAKARTLVAVECVCVVPLLKAPEAELGTSVLRDWIIDAGDPSVGISHHSVAVRHAVSPLIHHCGKPWIPSPP